MFYPLHITLLGLFEEASKWHISQRRTITAYLSIFLETCREANEVNKKASSPSKEMKTQIGRDTFLQSLRHSIKKILDWVTINAEQEVVHQSEDGFSALFEFALKPHTADLPKSQDMLFLKKETNMSMTSHLCHV